MSEGPLYNEKKLLLRVAAEDEHAFKLVFDHYWSKVFEVALSFLKTSDLAQDAVQQVFMKLWERRSHLSRVDNFDAWFFILARNTILDLLQRATAVKTITTTGDLIPEDFLTPASLLEYKETSKIIQEAIKQLPPQQALVFRLSREQGLSHAQIANELQIAPATVKSHLIRALNSVRTYVLQHSGNILLVIWLLAEKKS